MTIFSKVALIFSDKSVSLLVLTAKTTKIKLFLKIIREKFGQFRKKQYLCTRFQENGAKHRLKEGKKQEFFGKIYINRK